MKSRSGFTIVELIVVIVVIGILAGIGTVAYNGYQQRAKSSAWATALDTWSDIIGTYRAQKGVWPSTDNEGLTVCLGSGFPAENGFNEDWCLRTQNATHAAYVSSLLNTNLEAVVGELPQTILPQVAVETSGDPNVWYVRGLMYTYSANSADPPFIDYYINAETANGGCIGRDSLEDDSYLNGVVHCRRHLAI